MDSGDRDIHRSPSGGFGFTPDEANPGWLVRIGSVSGTFNDVFGKTLVRPEAPDRARIRVHTGSPHGNIIGTIHGGFLLALVDQSLFTAPVCLGIASALGGVTVDCAAQFLNPGRIGEPLDAVVEILRETGRMVFMRGLLEQGETRVLAFSGTIRKATVRA